MQSYVELQRKTIERAREFASLRNFAGGGFESCDYRKALTELSPEEREIERGLTPRLNDSQSSLAGKHFADEVAKHRSYGLSHAEAIERAEREEPPALKARRAGFDPVVTLDAGQRAWCQLFRVNEPPMKAYAAGVTDAQDKLGTLRLTLVNQIAADCLQRDVRDPNQTHASWADSWYGVVNPAPAPGATEVVLAAYNREREAAVNALLEDVRTLLRDPEQTAKLRPTVLR